MTRALPALLIGVAGLLAGAVSAPRDTALAWLAAWSWALDVAVGALVWLAIAHLAPMRWFAGLRPAAASVAGALPVLALGFLPIALAAPLLYPWMEGRLVTLAPELARAAQAKSAWLDPPAWYLRSAVWLLLLAGPALPLVRHARRTDPTGLRLQRGSAAAALVAVALGWTFSSYDWLLGLEPAAQSSIYTLVVVAHGLVGGLAAVVLRVHHLQARGALPALPPDVDHALGRLLLTAIALQAYFVYDQLMLIWIADLPEEVAWLHPRLEGPWGAVLFALFVAGFALPLALLLSRSLKRSRRAIGAVSAWLLAVQVVETWHRLLAGARPDGPLLHWVDPFAVLAAAAALGLSIALRAPRPVPQPLLTATLRYRSP